MEVKTWKRPADIPYPTVWSTFTRTDKNGAVLHFEIQDITEDLFPACVEHMTKYFLPDEPMYTALGFLDDPVSIEEQQAWWRDILPEKMSLVCLKKDPNNITPPVIAGLSLQYYHHKSHDKIKSELKGEKLKTICDIVKHIESQNDRYNALGIEDYIDEFGLSVHPDYRCMGLGTEILKTRIKLGKQLGFKASLTVFSAIASQKAAVRAGYKDMIELKFSDIQKYFPNYILNVKDTPTVRYMYMLF